VYCIALCCFRVNHIMCDLVSFLAVTFSARTEQFCTLALFAGSFRFCSQCAGQPGPGSLTGLSQNQNLFPFLFQNLFPFLYSVLYKATLRLITVAFCTRHDSGHLLCQPPPTCASPAHVSCTYIRMFMRQCLSLN